MKASSFPGTGSFRDPAGHVYTKDGIVYRQINHVAKDDYEFLMRSGLYKNLTDQKRLIPHKETDVSSYGRGNIYKIIEPVRIPFISYPYEWCFSQLKSAALLTLDILDESLAHNMILKDASAYNVQFVGSEARFIDTLSFTKYKEGQAWEGYQQFCKHFLALLLLMKYKDTRLNKITVHFIDGCPLEMASKLLPWYTWLKMSSFLHIHMHGKFQSKVKQGTSQQKKYFLNRSSLKGLIQSLRRAVAGINIREKGSHWGNYYGTHNYSDESNEIKKEIVLKFLNKNSPRTLWDLGGNTSVYGNYAADMGIETVSFENDHACVEAGFKTSSERHDRKLLTLVNDLTSPSPAIGWRNNERLSLIQRGPADMIMALAIVHHLAIGHNIPLEEIAHFMAQVGERAIVEFVPKEDSQTQKMLSAREDIFKHYNKSEFEKSFSMYFDLNESQLISGTRRILYLMTKKSKQPS